MATATPFRQITPNHDCRTIHTIGFDDSCVILADITILEYTRQITPVAYLYGFMDARGYYDTVTISRACPKYSEMVILTHIPRNMDRTALTAWFNEHLRRLPILNAVIR